MSRAATSSLVWGIYMVVLGAVLVFAPDVITNLFQLATAEDFWVRWSGGLLIAIGYLYLRAAQGEVRPFFRWSVEARPVVLVAAIAFVVLGMTQPGMIVFGVIEVLGAIWMGWALRQTSPATATA